MKTVKLKQDDVNDSTTRSSEEEKRKLLKPKATPDEILGVLRKSYRQTTEDNKYEVLQELESYDDNNFLVAINGVKYLLKVSNGVESQNYVKNPIQNVIHLQNLIFHQLSKCSINTSVPMESTDAQTGVSNPLITLHSLPVVSPEHSPQVLVVRLLRWVEGVPMSSMKSIQIETLAEAGVFLGKICRALDQLSMEEKNGEMGVWYHAWDGKQTKDLRKFLHCITNETRRAMVEKVIKNFEEEVLPESHLFRTGILQADFNDANIIMNDGKVSGVIDFGDTCKSWRVLDVTIAMAYAMLSCYGKGDHFLAAAAAILRGFNSIYPLSEIERKHLRLLMTCRLACSVTLGAYSIQQNPSNKYLLLHAEPGWKALEFLCREDSIFMSQVDNLFRVACDVHCIKDGLMECNDISLSDAKFLQTCQTSKKRHREQPIVTFVTGNKKKLEEVKRILSSRDGEDLPFSITNFKIDLPELQGEPSGIARAKCSQAVKEINGPVFIEDTSLCYSALNGLPGPYIKWFLDKCGHEGLNQMLAGYEDKTAYAQTIVAFCVGPNEEIHLFEGRTQGKIVPARGKLDFGWDPVFEPIEGCGKTYAQMTKAEKDSISHRSRAFQKFREFLHNHYAK